MKLKNARVEWRHGKPIRSAFGQPGLVLLVDSLPDKNGWRYVEHQVPGGTMYFAENEGMVRFFFHEPSNKTGYGGAVFDVMMADGTQRSIRGPWSSSSGSVNRFVGDGAEGFQECVRASLSYVRDGESRRYGKVHITKALAEKAVEKAGAHLVKVEYGWDGGSWSWVPSASPDRLERPEEETDGR